MIVTDADVALRDRLTALIDSIFPNGLGQESDVETKQRITQWEKDKAILDKDVGFKTTSDRLFIVDGYENNPRVQRVPHLFKLVRPQKEPIPVEFQVSQTYLPDGEVAFIFAKTATVPLPYDEYVETWNKIQALFPEGEMPFEKIEYGAQFRANAHYSNH